MAFRGIMIRNSRIELLTKMIKGDAMRTRRTGPGKGKKTGALRSAALLLACGGFCCSLIVFAALPVRGLQQESKPLPVNDYKIGAKDLLDITVFELPELNQTVRVSEDGSITLSMLGKVTVAGLSAQELEKKLGQLLEEKWLNTTAHVTVFIKEYQRVSVLGAVAKPGMYELVGPTNLLQILALAGGLPAAGWGRQDHPQDQPQRAHPGGPEPQR
jgi:protein involved in polysaccharide export with SLBB domain